MKKPLITLLILLVVAAAAAYFLGWFGNVAPGIAPSQKWGTVVPSTPGALLGTLTGEPESAQPAAQTETATAARPDEMLPAFDGNVAALQFGGMIESASGWEPRDPRIPVVLIDGDSSHWYWRSGEE